MKVKNRPAEYVKRSALPARVTDVRNLPEKNQKKPKDRDFMTVEIDKNFYFTFQPKSSK